MDETREILTAIMGGIKELNAKVTGLDNKVTGLDNKVTGLDDKVTGLARDLAGFRHETNERLTKIEERLEYLTSKYVEHDRHLPA